MAKIILTLLLFVNLTMAEINNRPIIGIISQALPSSYDYLSPGGSYIAASYVKWVEAAGARAVPLIAGGQQNISQMFGSLNGVLIPGGAVSLSTSPYSRIGKEIFDLAKEANDAGDVFPIWGTCLGFELLAFISNNEERNLARCDSQDQALPLDFLEGWEKSNLFKQASSDILDNLTNLNVTVNFHSWCLTMENFTKFEMEKFWTPLSVNNDEDGLQFISSFEAKNYPFYGVQFHPEKNNFEWTSTYHQIPHSREAVLVSNYFADVFVSQARQSKHAFNSRSEEEAELIYNYAPIFTGAEEIDWVFQHIYVFNNNDDMKH